MLPLKLLYNILHFTNILLSQNICTFWDMEIFLHPHPISSALPNLTFWPQKPKNSNLTNSFLTHHPQPKMNQKSPKDPKSILILTIKLLCTYGALIWLAPIWFTWAQIAQPKSPIIAKCVCVWGARLFGQRGPALGPEPPPAVETCSWHDPDHQLDKVSLSAETDAESTRRAPAGHTHRHVDHIKQSRSRM